jgi:Ser/Thr protein kinase RdoA (MazF antagonist)
MLDITLVAKHWLLDDIQLAHTFQCYDTREVLGLRARQGKFVAKVMANGAALGLVAPTTQQIEQRLHIFDYLRRKDFQHAPRLLRTRSGASFLRLDDITIYIMRQIEGSSPEPSAETYARLGRIAAQLNAHTDFPYAYPISVEGTIAELTRAADDYPFKDAMLEQIAKLNVLADHPVSLIHGEINPANAIQAPDGHIYLLDWDAAGTGPTILEAGYPLITTFLTEDCIFHRDWAAAFYGAYSAGAGMSSEQKELLFIAALLHALRYMGFHNPMQRWRRICFALDHKDLLLEAIPNVEH